MKPQKDFEYYLNLNTAVTNALLHLLMKVSVSDRFVPVHRRNEILAKYLKPMMGKKTLSNIKKDIRLMLNIAKSKTGNLEMRLYQLHEKSQETALATVERFYSLLLFLHDEEGIESHMFREGMKTESGILYLLEDHIENGFDLNNKQIAPISMFIQSERAYDLIDVINKQGSFIAEMQEWNEESKQAHLLIHPSEK